MKSELSPEQFHQRLTQLVTPEKTISLITRYYFSGKPFCGTFTNNSFELTKNSHWQHIKGMPISGTYRNGANGKTEVDFSVGTPLKWLKGIRVFFAIIVIVVNALLFLSNLELKPILTVNFWLAFVYFFGWGLRNFSRFVVNQKFKHEFEIDVKPTDLNGYGADYPKGKYS